MDKICAIIPAYNEEPRIKAVLEVVTGIDFFSEIIVVNDGSRDKTGTEAQKFPVKLIEHRDNRGKGAALQTGLEASSPSDIFFFQDADLIGLQKKHLDQLLEPVINEEKAAMSIGVFRQAGLLVDLAQNLFPALNGQRVLTGDFVKDLPDPSWSRFGVEILLNRFSQMQGVPVAWVPLKKISHWTKEQKDGLWQGGAHRLKMYRECLKCQFTYRQRIVRISREKKVP